MHVHGSNVSSDSILRTSEFPLFLRWGKPGPGETRAFDSESRLVFAGGVKKGWQRIALVTFAVVALVLVGIILVVVDDGGSQLPLVLQVNNTPSVVTVTIENPSSSTASIKVLEEYAGPSSKPPEASGAAVGRAWVTALVEAGRTWTNQFHLPKEGWYRIRVQYQHIVSPIERIQRMKWRFGRPVFERTIHEIVSAPFDVRKAGLIAAESTERELGPIGPEEQSGLEKVSESFEEMRRTAVPPFPQPLHITFPTKADLPYLIQCLADPSAYVREEAAAALGTFSVSAEEAIPALMHAVENDPEENVRKRAQEALYNIRGYDGGLLLPATRIER